VRQSSGVLSGGGASLFLLQLPAIALLMQMLAVLLLFAQNKLEASTVLRKLVISTLLRMNQGACGCDRVAL